MRSPTGPFARSLILTLASAQLVIGVLGPLHESQAPADHRASRVEQAQDGGTTVVHHADTCPICQYLAGHFLVPDDHGVPVVQSTQTLIVAASAGLLPARAPPTAHQTRAPPVSLV